MSEVTIISVANFIFLLSNCITPYFIWRASLNSSPSRPIEGGRGRESDIFLDAIWLRLLLCFNVLLDALITTIFVFYGIRIRNKEREP